MTQTIFETLRADHDEHRALMNKIAETSGNSAERRDAFRVLRKELESHAAAEERCLYANMLQSPSAVEMARHAIAEHHDVDELIGTLESKNYDDGQWLIAFRKLKDHVEHHMQEEEHGVFQLAGKVLGNSQKAELADAFTREKQRELERRS